MSLKARVFIVNNIKLPIHASIKEAFSVARKRLAKAGIPSENAKLFVYRKSVDARRKNDIRFVYSVAASGEFAKISEPALKNNDISVSDIQSLSEITFGDKPMSAPPLIVGAGPAGLFAALILAENGYSPILIERGGSVEERKKLVLQFNSTQILDTDTNIQFGAGGAGTFSDGKLVTRINDPISSYVLQRLVDFGAPEEILYLARPHIGTDILAPVIERIILEIERLGGRVHYHTKYIDTKVKSGVTVALTSKGEIPYGALILAVGHSARDTYKTLIEAGYNIEAKPFSVGMRIEHLADNIDRVMYGDFLRLVYFP